LRRLNKVEVKPSASALDENNKDLCCFFAMLEELQAIYNRSTCLEHVQILTESPFTTLERTMKEFLRAPCVKEPSIEETKGYSRGVV